MSEKAEKEDLTPTHLILVHGEPIVVVNGDLSVLVELINDPDVLTLAIKVYTLVPKEFKISAVDLV